MAASSTPSRTWSLVDNRSRPIRSVIGLPGDYISVPETEEIQTDAMELPTLVQLLAPHQGRQWCTHASDITSIVSFHHSKDGLAAHIMEAGASAASPLQWPLRWPVDWDVLPPARAFAGHVGWAWSHCLRPALHCHPAMSMATKIKVDWDVLLPARASAGRVGWAWSSSSSPLPPCNGDGYKN